MSSFRRATPSVGAARPGDTPVAVRRTLAGTKPFLNGQTLVSSGLTQLDAIVGGGWLLGTMVLLDVPRNDAAAASTGLVDDLHRYFVAEAVVAGQCAVVVADGADAFVTQQLPLELSLAQKQVKAQLAAMDVSSEETSEQLTIAWQYQKYIADSNSGTSKQRFCHSYDLSRSMHPELLSVNPPVVLDTMQYSQNDIDTSVRGTYSRLLEAIRAEVDRRRGQQVIRVAVRELGSPLLGPSTSEHMAALFDFMRRIRALCAVSREVIFQLSGHLYAFPVEFVNELRHLADYVLELKSFMGETDILPGELVEFNGLLEFKKMARVHALACHSLDAVKFGIKRERRKMKVEKFHLPPEGSRSSNDKDKRPTKQASSSSVASKSNLVSSSFVRKSKSGCGSGGGGSSGFDPLDF